MHITIKWREGAERVPSRIDLFQFAMMFDMIEETLTRHFCQLITIDVSQFETFDRFQFARERKLLRVSTTMNVGRSLRGCAVNSSSILIIISYIIYIYAR